MAHSLGILRGCPLLGGAICPNVVSRVVGLGNIVCGIFKAKKEVVSLMNTYPDFGYEAGYG